MKKIFKTSVAVVGAILLLHNCSEKNEAAVENSQIQNVNLTKELVLGDLQKMYTTLYTADKEGYLKCMHPSLLKQEGFNEEMDKKFEKIPAQLAKKEIKLIKVELSECKDYFTAASLEGCIVLSTLFLNQKNGDFEKNVKHLCLYDTELKQRFFIDTVRLTREKLLEDFPNISDGSNLPLPTEAELSEQLVKKKAEILKKLENVQKNRELENRKDSNNSSEPEK